MRAVEAAGGAWLGERVGGEGTVLCGVILPERYGRMHRVILSATLFAAALTPSARAPSSGVVVCGPGASCVRLPGHQRRLALRRCRHAALSCARIVPADAIHKGVSGKRSSVMAAAGEARSAGALAASGAAGRHGRRRRVTAALIALVPYGGRRGAGAAADGGPRRPAATVVRRAASSRGAPWVLSLRPH